MEADEKATISSAAEEVVSKARDLSQKAVEEGYTIARQYADQSLDYVGELSGRLGELVCRDPWIAVAGAFLVGYIAAQFMRRMSK